MQEVVSNPSGTAVQLRKLAVTYAVTFVVISLPFTHIHLMARPDDSPITPVQHVVAALANFFGPWGVAIVRLVDFPNAGLRSFSWLLAVGLTLLAGILIFLRMRIKSRPVQLLVAACWQLLSFVWFAVGLSQIADGLL